MGDSDKKEKPSFFSGVQTEFKKISWPDKRSLLRQSIAVISASVIVGVMIAVLDLLIQYGVSFLTM